MKTNQDIRNKLELFIIKLSKIDPAKSPENMDEYIKISNWIAALKWVLYE